MINQEFSFNLCKNRDLQILLIDNYDSFTFNIVEILRRLQCEHVTVVKNDQISIHDAKKFDKIIISPGPSIPTQSGNIIQIIQGLGPTHSILGICLGHQAIAEAFGAKLKNLPNPFHGFQTKLNQVLNDRVLNDLSENNAKGITIGLYHSWVVDPFEFPSSLVVTSYSSENHIMSLRHIEFDIHGLQFHPESYMTPLGRKMIENWLRG